MTEQAALVAGVSPGTIRQWVSRKHLRAYRRTVIVNGRARRVCAFDEREVLLVERATRQRGGRRDVRRAPQTSQADEPEPPASP